MTIYHLQAPQCAPISHRDSPIFLQPYFFITVDDYLSDIIKIILAIRNFRRSMDKWVGKTTVRTSRPSTKGACLHHNPRQPCPILYSSRNTLLRLCAGYFWSARFLRAYITIYYMYSHEIYVLVEHYYYIVAGRARIDIPRR